MYVSCLNLQLQACSPTLDTTDMLNWGSKSTKARFIEMDGVRWINWNGWSEKDLAESKE